MTADLLAKIPHRAPALLLDRVIEADPEGSRAELLVREGPWLRGGALAPEALVEALAQTCAVHAAAQAPGGGAPRAGALAALSRFEFPSRATPGRTVTLSVRLQARIGELVAFEGTAVAGPDVVARGELRVALLP